MLISIPSIFIPGNNFGNLIATLLLCTEDEIQQIYENAQNRIDNYKATDQISLAATLEYNLAQVKHVLDSTI